MKVKYSILTAALPAVLVAASLSTAQAAGQGASQLRMGAQQTLTAIPADPSAPALITVAETKPSTTTPKTQSDAQRRAEDAKRAETERNMQRIQAAKPLSEADAPIKKIMGASVRNDQYAKVATVEDLRLKDGKIAEVVIATGGFLGMGEDNYLIPIDQAKFFTDKDETFVLVNVTKENLKQFTEVEQKDGQWVPVAKAPDSADKPATGKAPSTDKAPATAPKEGQTDKEMKKPEQPTEKKDTEQQQ